MGMPKKVRLFGKNWKIKRPNAIRGKHGDCNDTYLVIRVSRQQGKDQEKDTLLHELTHSIEKELQLKMTEQQVRRFATAQLGLLRDNPKLVKYLVS